MKAKYLDSTLDIETRVNDLLKKMTVDEKINQLYTTGCNSIEELLKQAEEGTLPDVSATFVYAEFNPDSYDKLQKYQIEHNRLGIPLMLASENTHGIYNPECTVFPTTGCMAATFDDELIGRFAQASAKEARALGITQLYAPNVDISWDLRWGRVEENFGEDPYLTSNMGVQIVKNFQKEKVSSTVKHYIAYGLPESGINLSPAHVGELDIREYMLPPFEACIKKGKAWGVMPSYSEIDGIPVHASRYWMQDVLRKELGFDGMVMTDYGASNMLVGFHRVTRTPVETGKLVCDNRVDMEGCSYFGYCDDFRKLVKEGKYPIGKVNQCVKDVLRLKFRLGLFENPYSKKQDLGLIRSDKHLKIAREIAEKGIVLLKNDGALPLKTSDKIALIGPNADIAQFGNYIYYRTGGYKGKCATDEALTIKEVFEQSGVDFGYELGSEFAVTDERLLSRAEKLASESDVIVLALGSNSNGGENCGNQDEIKSLGATKNAVTSGEGYDLNEIELPDAQIRLFNRVKATGKPVILLLCGGKPHAITEQAEQSDGVLFTFGVGEQGNQALFDILYGKVNPSGKLPISMPRSTGHIPCYYNHKPSARGSFYCRPGSIMTPGRDYVFDVPDALYPFGYGLSYTKFEYSGLTVEKTGKANVTVKVNVKNVGEMDGDEVVMLYVSTIYQAVTPIVKKLRSYKRVHIKCGQTVTVEMKLNKEDFSYVAEDKKRKLSVGQNKILVGDLSADLIIG